MATCSECKYWAAVPRGGECRLNPPVPYVDRLGRAIPGQRGAFPTTDPTDWCGQFEQTPGATPATP